MECDIEYCNLDVIISVGYRGKSRSDYFDELIERVRAIRASEKKLYEKVRREMQKFLN